MSPRPLRHLLPAVLLLVLAALPAAAQDAEAETGTLLLRTPTVSDRHIVFVYANDLWVVDRDGGEARRLTSGPGMETNPRLSPDGRLVAFTAQYEGNADVYVVPVEGGEPRRLTFHPGADVVQGWTPDGTRVLFTSGRDGHPTARTRFFTVPVEGGFPEPLPIPRGVSGRLSEDGRSIAYRFPQFWDPEWRNYRGGQAQPIWIVSLDDHTLVTPPWEGERQLDPVWLDGVVYFLSERGYLFNVWSFDPRTGELRQRTFHTDFDVKSLDAGGGVIVYEQAGRLHLLDPATDTARPLTIHVRGDHLHARPRWVDVEPAQLLHGTLSPTGQRAAFEVRGQILTAPAEHGDWRNLSNSSASAHRFPAWSPDGRRIAYFSDERGEYHLVIAPHDGLGERREIALPEPSFFFHPVWSPDGRRIAYRDAGMSVWYVDLETERATRVDTERHAYPERSLDPTWSPDSRYLAYARRLDSHLRAVFVHDTQTGETVQLTDGMADAYRPQWSPDGKFLYFLASTDYGLNTGWLDMSSYDRPVTRGVYVAVLAADTPSPLAPRSSDEPDPDAPKEEPGANRGEVTVRIDLEGLAQRILALPMPQRDYVALHVVDGGLLVGERVPNETGLTLHRWDHGRREATRFAAGVQHAAVSADGKRVLLRTGQTWRIVGTAAAPDGNAGALSLAGVRIPVDPRAEWEQIFEEGWRIQRDFLYVDNFHGAPWDDIRTWYRPLLPHVRHRSDLNYLLDIMGAEIGVGHSYVSGGDLPSAPDPGVGLLGADFRVEDGHYRITRIFDGENWNPGLESPLAGPGLDVREGDFLVAVNGRPLTADENLYAAFAGTAGRQTVIAVNERPTLEGARTFTVVPVASEVALRTRAWVEANRRRVDELSGGRLAYVWLPNTGRGGYEAFNRYFFAQQDRQGVVLDVRDNGGGSAADYVIDVLARQLQGYFNSPVGDRRMWTQPIAGIFGPKVMIINEQAGSGGDLLPYLFRQMNLGPLVGTRTWGGLVGTWDTPRFVDGGAMIAPRGGFVDRDGQWAVENEGVAPDIEVVMTPREVMAGRDPQLERAVEEAMRLLRANPPVFHEEPPPPVRWRMPEGWQPPRR